MHSGGPPAPPPTATTAIAKPTKPSNRKKQAARKPATTDDTEQTTYDQFQDPRCLEALLRAAATHSPYLAGHGEVGDAWLAILTELQGLGFCFSSLEGAIRNKVNAMLDYHEVSLFYQ
jgi:hypothetical protein